VTGLSPLSFQAIRGRNRISEGTEVLEAYIQIAVPWREGTLDIVREDEVIAFGMAAAECLEICGSPLLADHLHSMATGCFR
jgi:hypothetical protein